MPSVLPHNHQIASDISKYLDEVEAEIEDHRLKLENSGEFRHVFKATMAADSFLAKLSSNEVPKLSAIRKFIRRIPVLVIAGQGDISRHQLRQVIELVFWVIYFCDHKIEWNSFELDPTKGLATDPNKPIEYCSFRERSFYGNYAKELFELHEPSGIAKTAASELNVCYTELNVFSHGAYAIRRPGIHPTVEQFDEPSLAKFGRIHKRVLSSSCIVLAAFRRKRFDSLPPVHRAWFDWLVGSSTSKSIRSGEFGISR